MTDDNKKQPSAHEQRILRHQQSKEKAQQVIEQKSSSSGKSYTKYYALGGILVAIIAIYLISFTGESDVPPMPIIGAHPFAGLPASDLNIQIFGDFQCPYTKKFYDETYDKLLAEYGDKARIEFHPMPTGKHNYDRISAEAAYCANEQGKFWEFADILFARQGRADVVALKEYAIELGLDADKFDSCLESGIYEDQVKNDYAEGKEFKVIMTPTVFINHLKLQGDLPFSQYQRYADFILER